MVSVHWCGLHASARTCTRTHTWPRVSSTLGQLRALAIQPWAAAIAARGRGGGQGRTRSFVPLHSLWGHPSVLLCCAVCPSRHHESFRLHRSAVPPSFPPHRKPAIRPSPEVHWRARRWCTRGRAAVGAAGGAVAVAPAFLAGSSRSDVRARRKAEARQ